MNADTTPPSVLKIAIRGIAHALDFFPPDGIQIDKCHISTRVKVNIHNRIRVGMIVSIGKAEVNPTIIKPCLEILDSQPLLEQELFSLMQWASSYYFCGIGEAVYSLLPHAMRHGQPTSQGGWQLQKPVSSSLLHKLSKPQQRLVQLMQKQDDCFAEFQVTGQIKRSLIALLKLGIVKQIHTLPANWQASHSIDALQQSSNVSTSKTSIAKLNNEQTQAVNNILQTKGYACHLLHGVTGSGKTEVYIALARQVIADGKQVLVLVPEIGLTPQTLKRFAMCFGEDIEVIHSALSNNERNRTWQSIRLDRTSLVIGTRSAIWAPFNKLGLIVVDEEHDGSFKQQSGFRYNARDLAIVRAQGVNCPVVLGSATPNLRSVYQTMRGTFRVVRLTTRAKNMPMPHIQLVDTSALAGNAYLAPASNQAIANCLEKGKQVLVYINRRGFAPVLHCQDCGWQAKCPHCDARMTLHIQPAGLLCHHCGERQHVPTSCPACNNTQLSSYGSGTQHIANVLKRTFPTTTIIRVDRDTIGSHSKMENTLKGITSNSAAILVGTQMLAKGHDFANLALVVVVQADNGLFSSDYRAPEVTLQLLMQVAGRAGRSTEQGHVLVQTTQPQAAYFHYLINNDYDGLTELLLHERQQYHLPPYTSMVLFRAQHTKQSNLKTFMQQAIAVLQPLAKADSNCKIIGPSPPALGKVKKHWQEQILLTHPNRTSLHRTCRAWHNCIKNISAPAKWWFDIDPYETL